MKTRIMASAFGFVALAAVAQLFQNCGGAAPGSANTDSKSSNFGSQSVDGPTATITKDPNSGLIQIGGTCNAASGEVSVSGDNVGKSHMACAGGTYMLCTLLPKLGNNSIALNQTINNAVKSTPETVFEEHPVVSSVILEITAIQVTGATSANITIRCSPGSAVASTIYGVAQLPATGEGASCPSGGTMTFPVTLVASLVGTGQRVVYVTQTTQAGTVFSVFADVDHVVTAHTCALTAGQSNATICVASAGTVSGTCKGGSPVKISVNDELEEVVPCKENNTFSADNIVMTKAGANKISVDQKSPFNTTCHAEQSVSMFSAIH